MKILAYGHKGWIGKQFVSYLIRERENISLILGQARADDEASLLEEVDQHEPDHVVCFIGRTHGEIDGKVYTTIDYLEQEGKLVDNVRDNLYAPITLANACKERGIHFTYLGTGCIFAYDGEGPGTPYTEEDKPDFTGSGYSTVKGFTDRLMHQYGDNVLNLRIRMPIVGYDCQRNFITKIKSYAKVCSMKNSMTVLPDMIPVMVDLMEANITGTMNLTNPGHITHNEILEMYKEKVDPAFTWENFSVEEQNRILDSKRSNNVLDTRLLESMASVPNIKDSISRLMDNYKIEDIEDTPSTDMVDNDSTTLLVTGGAGFIGSNFINHLHANTHSINIINFDALYYCANKDNVNESVRCSPRYTFVEGNLRSLDLLRHLFQSRRITHVVHFAAQSHVQTSFDDSLTYTMDNIVGTHNLLETARLHAKDLVKFVHVSTDEVYGESMLDNEENKKTEHSILCPTNPYAATKAGAELIAQSYSHSFGMPIVVTRGNNVYGPNQYPEKLVPRFIQLLSQGKKVTIQGDGSCVRAFLHAEDTARAFKIILEKGKLGEIYNIGCDEGMEYSVAEVANMIIERMKPGEPCNNWITFIEDRPFNDKRYYISNQKLKDLGWSVEIDFETGLDALIK
jgi:dTDP-glucose 4,6-dehydratase/UDP-glucose 4,6-dehydratase